MDSTRPIRALVRGLEALAVLNLREGGTVSEVAQEVGLPRTTVYRILETLCDSGLVVRDSAAERYRPTVLVRALSAGFREESWMTQVAKPCLFELGESIVWPVNIATLADSKLIVREATDHHSPLAMEHISAGATLPLLTTSAGRAYLAHCSLAQRTSLLDTLMGSHDAAARWAAGRGASGGAASGRAAFGRPARGAEELSRSLQDTATLGYATDASIRGMVEELSISVPVRLQQSTADQSSLAVLTVRFAASAVPLQTGLERFLPKLRRCAAKIGTTFRKTADAHERLQHATAQGDI
jgi:IclR family mhp operon transcriptional activator